MTDIIDIVQEREVLASLRRHERARLPRTAGSRDGRCVDCDEPIAPARLRAAPEAVRCIACQRLHERRHG